MRIMISIIYIKNLYLTELLMAKICFENKFKLNICDVKNVVISINEIMKKENFNFCFWQSRLFKRV